MCVLCLVFDNEIWEKISTLSYNYPKEAIEKYSFLPKERPYLWPNTNGRSKSRVFDNLYFPGFDQGYLGGLTIGIYSWQVGEDIAYKLGKLQNEQRQIKWEHQ